MAQAYPSHQLVIGTLSVEVTVKPIKNLHLSVVPRPMAPCAYQRLRG